MTKPGEKTFLGRGGKTFGPFGKAEMEAMRLSGEIDAFTFLWDTEGRKWVTLDSPPPDIGAAPAKPAPADLGREVICLASNTVLGGFLENLTDLGCELVSNDTSESPTLMIHSSVVLNVTDASGSQGKNLKASLAKVTRREGKWIYGLRWVQRPTFL